MGVVFSQYQECQIKKVFILILQQSIWWTETVEAKKIPRETTKHKDNMRGGTEKQTRKEETRENCKLQKIEVLT